MLVKYIGVPDQMTCDFNGKRYVFEKKNPVSNVPIAVFRLVVRESNGILSEQVIPFEEQKTAIPYTEPKTYKYEDSEKEVKKRGRHKNDKRK